MTNEISNADRAAFALAAITDFIAKTGVDTARDAISDLIVDLLHLARGRGLNAQTILNNASGTFKEETLDDTEGPMTDVQSVFMRLLPQDA